MKKIVLSLIAAVILVACRGADSKAPKSFRITQIRPELLQSDGYTSPDGYASAIYTANPNGVIGVSAASQRFFRITVINAYQDPIRVEVTSADSVFMITDNETKGFRPRGINGAWSLPFSIHSGNVIYRCVSYVSGEELSSGMMTNCSKR